MRYYAQSNQIAGAGKFMCRLLGYLGQPIALDRLLYKPDHSLIVQSYAPKEMTAGLMNADGFGLGWYHPARDDAAYAYRNVLPIWNDTNLPSLSRYIESGCVVASVRSATPGLAVNLSNCPPFQRDRLLMVHNGFIEQFHKTLYRPLRDRLATDFYQTIQGSTDSEHLFALIIQTWQQQPQMGLEGAIAQVVQHVFELATRFVAESGEVMPNDSLTVGANLIISDGDRLIACRASNQVPVPSLYWLRDDVFFPKAVVVASEPLFDGKWHSLPEQSVITVEPDLNVNIQPLTDVAAQL